MHDTTRKVQEATDSKCGKMKEGKARQLFARKVDSLITLRKIENRSCVCTRTHQ